MGCSGTSLTARNSVTLHNDWSLDIVYFSVSRIGAVGEVAAKEGVNLLPEPLPPGESFVVKDLVDGNYQLACKYLYAGVGGTSVPRKEVTQSIEGGRNYDWYFNGQKSSDEREDLVAGAPTAKCLLDCLLGL
jgi:hypothetical protein